MPKITTKAPIIHGSHLPIPPPPLTDAATGAAAADAALPTRAAPALAAAVAAPNPAAPIPSRERPSLASPANSGGSAAGMLPPGVSLEISMGISAATAVPTLS